MSGDTISIELQERTVLRKGLQHLRASGQIPAVIHNHGQESIHVMGDSVTMHKIYSEAGKHHPVQVTIGKQQHLTLIKDVDFEPTKHRMRHIVFQAINQNEETEAEIPIAYLEVEIPAERASLLVLKQLDRVQVKALPKDLPDELVVDLSVLVEVGDHVTVANLVVPQGVTILTDPTSQIAVVEMPKDQVAEADAAAASLADDAGVPDEEEATTGDSAEAESGPGSASKSEESKGSKEPAKED